MRLKIACIFILSLLVLSSAVPVKENMDYSKSDQTSRKQRSLITDFLNRDSPLAPNERRNLERMVGSLMDDSIDPTNKQVMEYQILTRLIAGEIADINSRLSDFEKRVTQLENMPTALPESTPLTASTSNCGGRLLGDSGVISYKEYERYNNGESCTWMIEVPEALKIGFKLEKSGLEHCCDHVNVTSLDTVGLAQREPVELKSYRTAYIDGSKALVRFSSDRSETGLGFRLSYFKVTDLNSIVEELIVENTCGGVIVGESGEISYKFEERYSNNERCVWLLHSPNTTSITFNLQQARFEKCCDFVSITTIDPEAGTLRNDTQLLKENDDNVTIQESLAVIVFSSDPSNGGTGFLLKFSASGVNTDPKYVFKLRHIAEPNATIEYPESQLEWDNVGITKQQHIYVTATSATTDIELSPKFVSEIDLNEGIFLKANDSSCIYDSLTFYEPVVIRQDDNVHVWQKNAQIPSADDTLLCPESFYEPKQEAIVDFGIHSFLAIYKPIKSDAKSNARISFDYHYKPYKCFEVVQPLEDEFGVISYKENENYKNDENCSWIIEVTNAKRIDFNLEQSGFEECCDFVTVTSLDIADQKQGPSLKLRSGSPTASVEGSRAIVNFKSDRSNVGSGFRFRYESGMPLDASANVCGGVLNPLEEDFGVISYKANENYANNENCLWRIEAPEWARIGFNLEQSNFENCCDFVTISSVGAHTLGIDQPLQLKYDNRNASIAGSKAFVRFTSDGSGTGTGFRLRFQKLPALAHQDEETDEIALAIQELRNQLINAQKGSTRNQK